MFNELDSDVDSVKEHILKEDETSNPAARKSTALPITPQGKHK